MSKVGIIMGSKSDYPIMNEASKVLECFNKGKKHGRY